MRKNLVKIEEFSFLRTKKEQLDGIKKEKYFVLFSTNRRIEQNFGTENCFVKFKYNNGIEKRKIILWNFLLKRGIEQCHGNYYSNVELSNFVEIEYYSVNFSTMAE